MFQPASVQLSGPAFSFLLYEADKAAFKQYGFLIGEIIHKETVSITDNDQRQIDVSKIIKINSVMPVPDSQFFSKGRVDKEKLKKFLGSNFDRVVAWYKYQPCSAQYFELTLKDRAVHKQLRELFDIPQDLFSCCFLSMDYTDTLATYKYIQAFVRYDSGNYEKLSVTIPNLSEPNNTYKNSEPTSFVFNKILSNLKVNIQNSKGIVVITEIENAVQKHINGTALELAKREKYLFELEKEVQNLKKSYPQIDVENDLVDPTSLNDENESDDMISFEEEEPELPVQLNQMTYAQKLQKREASPELVTRTRGNNGRIRKKSDLSENEIEVQIESDSNRRESDKSSIDTPNNSIEMQKSETRNNPTVARRGRGAGLKSKKSIES